MAKGDASVVFTTELDDSGVNKGMDKLKTSVGGMAGGVGVMLGTLAAGVAGSIVSNAAAYVNGAIEAASDLQEVQNVVDTTFGNNAASVNAWAVAAKDAYGMSELKAKQFTSTMGAMLKSMGLTSDQTLTMSKAVAGLSGDMASFYNLDYDEAFEKIRSGISGETEPLKQLGINMSVANLEAFALAEVERAVDWIESARPSGFDGSSGMPLCVLHCTSNYPAEPEALNLRAIRTLADALALPVGYSDHSEGVNAALAAVALGAVVIEKHITFDKAAPGPDHRASMTAEDFAAYVRAVREVTRMLGDGVKAPHPSELDTLAVARRSIVAARPLSAGHVLERSDLVVRRPAGGLEPAELEALVGRTLREPLTAGQALAWAQLSERA